MESVGLAFGPLCLQQRLVDWSAIEAGDGIAEAPFLGASAKSHDVRIQWTRSVQRDRRCFEVV